MPKYKPQFKTGDKIKLKEGLPKYSPDIPGDGAIDFRKRYGNKFEVLSPDKKGRGGIDLEVKSIEMGVTFIGSPGWFEIDET